MRSDRSILNPDFVYRDSANTDVGKTIRREIKRLKEKAEADKKASESAVIKIAARKIGKP